MFVKTSRSNCVHVISPSIEYKTQFLFTNLKSRYFMIFHILVTVCMEFVGNTLLIARALLNNRFIN